MGNPRSSRGRPGRKPCANRTVRCRRVTLIGDTARGNRPSFTGAAPPQEAEPLVERFSAALRELGVPVETGVFGARMEVELVNAGPVTIVLESSGDRHGGDLGSILPS